MKKYNWGLILSVICNLIFWVVVVSLFSCTPERRLSRLIKKNPELQNVQIDTVVTSEVKKDTIFDWRTIKDTVIVKESKLTIKYFHTDSTVYLSGKCESDTIYVEKRVIEVEDKGFFDFDISFWGYALIALLVLIILIRKK